MGEEAFYLVKFFALAALWVMSTLFVYSRFENGYKNRLSWYEAQVKSMGTDEPSVPPPKERDLLWTVLSAAITFPLVVLAVANG